MIEFSRLLSRNQKMEIEKKSWTLDMTDEYEYYSNNNMCNVCQAQWIVFNQKSAKNFQ